MLHASANNTAQRLTCRSSARARPSLRWVNASANRVQRQTSNSTSENATRAGSIAVVVERSALSCSGSSSASSWERSGRSAPASFGDLQGNVLGQPLDRLPVGAVELAAEPIERLPWVGLEVQAGADLRSRGPPRRAAQELRARVGEPAGARE